MSLIIRTEGSLGHITLDKPKALHALDLPMCEGMIAALQRWAKDPAIKAVLVDHKPGTRGFCAGGDIRVLAESVKLDGVAAANFFRTEYQLDALVHDYKKPYVAVMDGTTMGGGVGISVNGSFRVATENTTFAMPETGIGLFPDVGGGWFLPRLAGHIGLWLALTGARLKAADCLAVGIVTHFVPAGALPALKQALKDAAQSGPAAIKAALDAAHCDPGPAPIDAVRDKIDRLFAGDSVDAILEALRREDTEWARAQCATIATKSPQSLKVAFRQLHEGSQCKSFVDVMRMELRIANRIMMRPDFSEGVRATILEKDNAPKWDPPTLDGVTDVLLDQIFAPLPRDQEFSV